VTVSPYRRASAGPPSWPRGPRPWGSPRVRGPRREDRTWHRVPAPFSRHNPGAVAFYPMRHPKSMRCGIFCPPFWSATFSAQKLRAPRTGLRSGAILWPQLGSGFPLTHGIAFGSLATELPCTAWRSKGSSPTIPRVQSGGAGPYFPFQTALCSHGGGCQSRILVFPRLDSDPAQGAFGTR
jgi:hypothetical protein